jgi:hypothetical protein
VSDLTTFLSDLRQRMEYEIHMAMRSETYQPSPGQWEDHVHNRVAHIASDTAMAVLVESLPDLLELVGKESGGSSDDVAGGVPSSG